MIRNAQVTVQVPVLTRTSDGVIVKDWNPDSVWIDAGFWDDHLVWADGQPTFWCDLQPAGLNDYQRETWGIQDLSGNTKKLFLDITGKSNWPFIAEGNRLVFQGQNYDIRGSNPWGRHLEAILTPAQGE